ncbi:MAG: transcription antitermination factor NusB [Ignavibacteriales bacterium CG12_big_fil_rev_8_21_14_0_65_30_8]|nr:MAG: transcription antitermination factor NusB [Ignavibacteriales bacterium CG12_big_fil_rev_8_21_14_0_65_30_8]
MAKFSKRRIVREKVLQILYAYELNQDSHLITKDEILLEIKDENDKKFAEDLINRVIINKDNLDKRIKDRVTNWEISRIALLDKVLLRIGICELLFFPEIPPKVSINETIEIAKLYSTTSSGKFINGIMDAILSELKEKKELNKSGRGLVEETISKKSDKK